MSQRHSMEGEGQAMFDCFIIPAHASGADFPAISPESEVKHELKKRTKPFYRCDKVRVWKLAEERWLIRYTDPKSGRDVRVTKTGLNSKEVIKIANFLAGKVIVDGGYLPAPKPTLPTLSEGITLAIRLSTARDYVKKDMALRGAPFVKWMAAKHPHVKHWGEIRPTMLIEYARACEAEKLSYHTVRLRLHIVKLAWRTVQQDYPDQLPIIPRIKLTPPPRVDVDCLSCDEFAQLLDWLSSHDRQLWGLAALMGLAGLRENEATSLRVQDVDLHKWTLTVCSTPEHKVKTNQSARTIPLTKELHQILSVMMDEKTLWPLSGELLTTSKGDPWKKNALVYRWRMALRGLTGRAGNVTRQGAAEALQNPRLATVHPHRLRATFATTASRLGCEDRLVKAYLGHKATDTFGLHYRAIDLYDLGAVADRMNDWRLAGKTTYSPNPVRQISGIENSENDVSHGRSA